MRRRATAEASQNVAEGATVTGTLDFAGGADGATVTHIGATALVFNPADANYSQAIDIGAGFIKVKADGSYSFTADNPVLGRPAVATFTVTDADGDTATASVSFAVIDANVADPRHGCGCGRRRRACRRQSLRARPATSMPMRRSDGADNNEATFSGTLGGSVGLDGAGSNGFSFAGLNGQAGTVGQETVTYSWTAGSNTLTATTVGGTRPGTALFTVQVTDAATGAYTVTLLDNVLHAWGPNDENDATAALQLLDHRRRRLDRQRHADRHLRRRCADGDGGGLAERGGRRDGDRHAGLRRRAPTAPR